MRASCPRRERDAHTTVLQNFCFGLPVVMAEIRLPFVEQASSLRGQDARSTAAKLAPHSTSSLPGKF
ncbi:MAG: hypothetical protein WCA35_06375 [Kovacikia sp.]